MFWDKLKNKDNEQFKRYTGIQPPTFSKMVETVKNHEKENRNNRSRPFKYSVEDRILIMLDYYREYPTFFHLAIKYNLHESTVYRIVTKLEDILIKSGKFNLPGKKVLKSDMEFEVIVVDATEQPIERPKRNRTKSGKKN